MEYSTGCKNSLGSDMGIDEMLKHNLFKYVFSFAVVIGLFAGSSYYASSTRTEKSTRYAKVVMRIMSSFFAPECIDLCWNETQAKNTTPLEILTAMRLAKFRTRGLPSEDALPSKYEAKPRFGDPLYFVLTPFRDMFSVRFNDEQGELTDVWISIGNNSRWVQEDMSAFSFVSRVSNIDDSWRLYFSPRDPAAATSAILINESRGVLYSYEFANTYSGNALKFCPQAQNLRSVSIALSRTPREFDDFYWRSIDEYGITLQQLSRRLRKNPNACIALPNPFSR